MNKSILKLTSVLAASFLTAGALISCNSAGGKSSESESSFQSEQPDSSDGKYESSMNQPESTSSSGSQPQKPTNPYAGYYEYFKDKGYKNGFTVSSNSGSVSDIGKLRITEGTSPVWQLAQWNSKYNIMDNAANLPLSIAGRHAFYSERIDGKSAKRVIVNDNGAITLELNASMEYDEPRKPNEPWSHLLIAQSWNGSLLNVARAKDIRMIMDFTLDKFEDHMDGQANRNTHAAQFVWYVTIQNRNRQSAGYGEYVWFGLILYDNRSEYPSFYAAHDNGTSAFIYQPDAHDFLPEPVSIGNKIKIDFCLSDYARKAFDLAKERGYMQNTSWNDLHIGGMNTGFEIPGTYDIAVTIQDISIKYKY